MLIGSGVTFIVGYLASMILPKPRARSGKTAVVATALITWLVRDGRKQTLAADAEELVALKQSELRARKAEPVAPGQSLNG